MHDIVHYLHNLSTFINYVLQLLYMAFSLHVQVAVKLRNIGAYEISLGDTIGVGTPGTQCIATLLLSILASFFINF